MFDARGGAPVIPGALAHQQLKRGLERTFDAVPVAEDAVTDADNHRPVALNEHGEGNLFPMGQESIQELAIGPMSA